MAKLYLATPLLAIITALLSQLSSIQAGPPICGPLHIRNDISALAKLTDCEVINGPLTIALISNPSHPYEQADYDNITFPKLREITDFLLLFRVEGLTTLSKLFPNLAVIGGRELVSNYALIFYANIHLQEINLPNLNDILRGSVRIELNPNLCFYSTIDWDRICKKKYVPHFIKDNKNTCSEYCSESCETQHMTTINWDDVSPIEGDVKRLGSNNDRFCWSSSTCQRICKTCTNSPCIFEGLKEECCSPECAGGCYKSNDNRKCISCRSVLEKGMCKDKCSKHLYEHNGQCLTQQECHELRELPKEIGCSKPTSTTPFLNYKAIPGESHGKCQATCPANYQEDELHKNECKPCDNGKCRKVCALGDPYTVTNIHSLKELSGCVIINGSLELSLKGGKNVNNELEIALKDLEEITGYLKITRSAPLMTLAFLENLHTIGGEKLDREEYSFIVVDNPNLQELFLRNDNSSKKIELKKGKIFIHLNPKLCPSVIDKMKIYTNIREWNNEDVSRHSNGDKEVCVKDKLLVAFHKSTSKHALIHFDNYVNTMNDSRKLLYYLINYREVPEGNVTFFDGRDGCFSQNDRWITQEESPKRKPGDNTVAAIIKIKPATRYALYVKTFTLDADSRGAMSDIIYFVTAPDTPGRPRNLMGRSRSPNDIHIKWLPPLKPNGRIDEYTIKVTKNPELEDLQNVDICKSVDGRDKIAKSITEEESIVNSEYYTPHVNATSVAPHGTNGQNATCTCENAADKNDADIQQEVLTFQDVLIDLVYCKNVDLPKSLNSSSNEQLHHRSVRSSMKASISMNDVADARGNIDSSSQSTITQTDYNNNITSTISNVVNGDLKEDPESASAFTTKFEPTNDSLTIVLKMDQYASLVKGKDYQLHHSITGLHHSTSYSIEIRACHAMLKNQTNISNPKDSTQYERCSVQELTLVRTQPKQGADSINKASILIQPKNETSPYIVTWNEPTDPNGLILAYLVRFRHIDSPDDIWTEGCINRTSFKESKGFNLQNLPPGLHRLQIRAISMATSQGEWSEVVEFSVKDSSQISMMLIMILFIMICTIASSGCVGIYIYKKRLANANDLLAYASVNPDYMQYEPDGWEVDKNNLTVCSEPIGKGSFGMVYKGILHTEKGDIDCAVKTVPRNATAPQRIEFLNEASIMKKFDTYHVIKLLGVVSASTPVYVIMEYMEKGDLKNYLRTLRPHYEQKGQLIFEGICQMASQIADGMAYLSTQKYVHRDLAARNCFVSKDCTVKIGDFGMTRDIYDNDYYRRGTSAKLPVRWMAPEALKDNVYTTSSDVWSFGIVVWEMATFSASPYRGQSNDEVITKVVAGQTLPTPPGCPDRLANLMESCWKYSPADRPTFMEIVEYLLPETKNDLSPHSFYFKAKSDETLKHQSVSDQECTNTGGTESYPLLSWPSIRTNGLSNGVTHINNDNAKIT